MKLLLTALSAAFIFGASHSSALAAGGDSEPTAKVKNCKKGQVYDKKAKKCVDEEKSSLNDADLYDNGRALAYAGRFEEAIAVLNKIENRDTPQVLNYLGYATRNAGDVAKGIEYYRAALALDPDYTLARSYMGQALLKMGDEKGAIAQLNEIRARKGKNVIEYKLLAQSIAEKDIRNSVIY